jgi:hypothetical protein
MVPYKVINHAAAGLHGFASDISPMLQNDLKNAKYFYFCKTSKMLLILK